MMEVILLERIEKLGQMGDIVSVKPGYARNFLLPQEKALRANAENRSKFDAMKAQLEADNLKAREDAEAVAEKMDGASIPMVRQASDTGVLYGSVSTRDIAMGATDAGFTINRAQVVLDRAIKTLGSHDIKVRLHPEVSVTISILVAKSEEEALGLVVEEEEEAPVFEFSGLDDDADYSGRDDNDAADEEGASEE